MDTRALRSDGLLLLTAAIWGTAFAAQRAGMEYIGPFLYSGVRFALGALVLTPLAVMLSHRKRHDVGAPVGQAEHGAAIAVPETDAGGHFITDRENGAADGTSRPTAEEIAKRRALFRGGLLAGALLTAGVTLQQVGLVYTTAGKAGFITGLYVVLVPIFGIVKGYRTGKGSWAGAILAVAGLYLLSGRGALHPAAGELFGDLLVLACSVFWAFHVLALARMSRKLSAVLLSIIQYMVCSIVNMILAISFEPIALSSVLHAAVPIIYGGVCSVGIGYTLQVVAQKHAPPGHAAIILSLEGVFAVVGGAILLSEQLSPRGIAGCSLMLVGMIVSQMTVIAARRRARRKLV